LNSKQPPKPERRSEGGRRKEELMSAEKENDIRGKNKM
jgi:hypothetical protein